MRHHLSATLSAAFVIVSVGTIAAQDQTKTSTPPPTTTVELTGCVALTPSVNGQFGFIDGATGGTYSLSGKGLKKYAGQRVTIVGGPPTKKRLQVRGGLWPSANIAGQQGALDPAQESIERNSGGTTMPGANPELKVVRVRGAEGAACR
jgi:hypothetical protein